MRACVTLRACRYVTNRDNDELALGAIEIGCTDADLDVARADADEAGQVMCAAALEAVSESRVDTLWTVRCVALCVGVVITRAGGWRHAPRAAAASSVHATQLPTSSRRDVAVTLRRRDRCAVGAARCRRSAGAGTRGRAA
jgi:hypothetical protein